MRRGYWYFNSRVSVVNRDGILHYQNKRWHQYSFYSTPMTVCRFFSRLQAHSIFKSSCCPNRKNCAAVSGLLRKIKSESSIHSVKPYAISAFLICSEQKLREQYSSSRRGLFWTHFYSQIRNYRYGISKNSNFRVTFSAIRNSFCKNMKAKNAGSTQRWLGNCGSSIFIWQRWFLNTFFIVARVGINENRTSVEKTDGGSAHYKYYTALHRHYRFQPNIARFAGPVMRVRRFLWEGVGLCCGFVGAQLF